MWKKHNLRYVFITVFCLVGIFMGLMLYRFWTNRIKQKEIEKEYIQAHESFFKYGLYLCEAITGRTLDEFIPSDYPEGKIFSIDITGDSRFGEMNPDVKVYAVKIESSSSPLKVNGRVYDDVIGFLACDGLDGKIDYSEKDRSLIQYWDDIPGATDGDPAVFFRDSGVPDLE